MDGLLEDEEYRLLRTQVFERFAASPTAGGEALGTAALGVGVVLGEGNEAVPMLNGSRELGCLVFLEPVGES